ncbi:MAG: PA2779 family protein [Terracidiphilus sp.]
MRSSLWQFVRSFMAVPLFTLAMAFAIPQTVVAQTSHLVSPADMQQAVVDASQSRQQNLDTLNRFLSTDQARQAMQSAHVNQQEVKKAVAGLSDQKLAQLASRASKAQSDFAAGNIDNHDLILIILAVVVLILLIAIFH